MGSILGAVMGFLKISIYTEDFDKKENREQSLIPFFLQTSLSLSYLLHNLMSQELFGEVSKPGLGGGRDACSHPSLTPKKVSGIGVLISQM